ncbi:hypothetical protein QYF36_006261 [Acer negundo]|nr:hypothetical protein QYF36_006261 [Acer negundo]
MVDHNTNECSSNELCPIINGVENLQFGIWLRASPSISRHNNWDRVTESHGRITESGGGWRRLQGQKEQANKVENSQISRSIDSMSLLSELKNVGESAKNGVPCQINEPILEENLKGITDENITEVRSVEIVDNLEKPLNDHDSGFVTDVEVDKLGCHDPNLFSRPNPSREESKKHGLIHMGIGKKRVAARTEDDNVERKFIKVALSLVKASYMSGIIEGKMNLGKENLWLSELEISEAIFNGESVMDGQNSVDDSGSSESRNVTYSEVSPNESNVGLLSANRRISSCEVVWNPFSPGHYKVNCDATLDAKRRNGFGLVIRDSNDFVMAASSQVMVGSFNAQAAEVIGILKGIQFSTDCGLFLCSFEFNAEVVVRWINEKSHLDFAYGVVLTDIISTSFEMTDVRFDYTPRQGNQVVHLLPKNVLLLKENRRSGFLVWLLQPTWVLGLVVADGLGLVVVDDLSLGLV